MCTRTGSKHHRGVAVSPLTPGQELGLYWGYNVRLASNFGSVFTECPFQVSEFRRHQSIRSLLVIKLCVGWSHCVELEVCKNVLHVPALCARIMYQNSTV